MTKQKKSSKSLMTSGLSLLACIALLLGTTFAWFTDSAASGRNTITAGNLDVELYVMDDAGNYQPVSKDEALFDDSALWEPGHTEVVYLKVANEGTLALKYQLAVTVAGETAGTNVAGESFKLSDYLMFGAVEGQDTKFASRGAAIAAVTNPASLSNYSKPGNLVKDSEDYVALVVYMPETVGNKANYKTGTTAPSIQLGVDLVATQDTVESDSFDNTYDADASYPATPGSLDQAIAAMKEGDTLVLAEGVYDADILLPFKNASIVGAGADKTIINGYVQFGTNDASQPYTGGTWSVKGVTIADTADNTTAEIGISLASNESVTGGSLTVEDSRIEGFLFGTQLASGVTDSSLTVKNTVFENVFCALSVGGQDVEDKNTYTASGVTFNNVLYQLQTFYPNLYYVTIDGEATDGNSVTKPSLDSWHGSIVVDGIVHDSLEEAIDAAATGSTLVLPVGFKADETVAIDKSLTIDGNGVTLTQPVNVTAEDVELKDLKVEIPASSQSISGHYAGVAIASSQDLTLTGCTVGRTITDYSDSAQAEGAYSILVNVGDNTLTATNTVFTSPCSESTDLFNRSPSVIHAKGGVDLDGCTIATNGYGLFAEHVTKGSIKNTLFTGVDGKPTLGCFNSTVLDGLVFDHCTFEMGENSIVSGGHFTVKNSTFDLTTAPAGGAGNGINVYNGNGNIVLEDNTFHFSTSTQRGINLTWFGGAQLPVGDASQVSIKGNVFYGNGATAIRVTNGWSNPGTVEQYTADNTLNGNLVEVQP